MQTWATQHALLSWVNCTNWFCNVQIRGYEFVMYDHEIALRKTKMKIQLHEWNLHRPIPKQVMKLWKQYWSYMPARRVMYSETIINIGTAISNDQMRSVVQACNFWPKQLTMKLKVVTLKSYQLITVKLEMNSVQRSLLGHSNGSELRQSRTWVQRKFSEGFLKNGKGSWIRHVSNVVDL